METGERCESGNRVTSKGDTFRIESWELEKEKECITIYLYQQIQNIGIYIIIRVWNVAIC